MPEANWQQQGATLSHKNACKEYGLTEDEVIEAMRAGKLQYRQNWAHGNPYYRLLRAEVESLALELHGTTGVEEQETKHKLQKVTKEINSHKRKLASLEKEKVKLLDAQSKQQRDKAAREARAVSQRAPKRS